MSTESVTLPSLLNEPLCAVTFIWDYYQFVVGKTTLSVYTSPKIFIKREMFTPTQAGFRDALCSLIGAPVLAASEDANILSISFGELGHLDIPLGAEDRVSEGPESLVIDDGIGGVTVYGDSEG